MFQMPYSVTDIAVVGNADKVAELEFIHSGFFLDLAQGRYRNVFAGFLMALGKIPHLSAPYKEIVAAAVRNQAAGCIDFLEFRAQAHIGSFLLAGLCRDVDAAERSRGFEKAHKGVYVDFISDMEFHRVGVSKPGLAAPADYNATLFEIYFVHRIDFRTFVSVCKDKKIEANFMVDIESKHGIASKAPYELYMAFADMRNFVNFLPEDKKAGITADYDSIHGNVQGFDVGAKISDRHAYSRITMVDDGAPFGFFIELFFDAVNGESNKTDFHIHFSADLNFMMKMVIGSKLQEALDKMVDGLVAASEGRMPQM